MNIYGNRDRYIEDLLEAQQRELEELRKEPEDQRDNPEYVPRFEPEPERYTKQETFAMIRGALKSGLLIAGVWTFSQINIIL